MIKFKVLLFNLDKNILIAEKPIHKTIVWLEEGEPWVRYRTKLDLLQADKEDPLVMHEYNAMISNPMILSLIDELEHKNQQLTLVKSIMVDSEDAHDARIRINRIVREIDRCIALLNR